MFSLKSIKNFLTINTIIIAISYYKYLFNSQYLYYFAFEFISTLFLLKFLKVKKPYIHGDKRQLPIEEYKGEFLLYTGLSSIIKSVTNIIIIKKLISQQFSRFIYFIPISFIFELIFDKCHYIMHRIAHTKYFYKFHKTHHKFIHPCAETTFYMHPIDLILSYSIPIVIATFLTNISELEFCIITVYLTYQEIAGHLGMHMYPTSSFAQFIWLPRLIDIQLYTEDHDLHHSQFKYNYAKRFNIWDKLFGTFQSSNFNNKYNILNY